MIAHLASRTLLVVCCMLHAACVLRLVQPRRRPLPVDDEASSDDGALYSPLTPLLSPAAHKVEVDMTIHKIVAERNVLQLEEFAAVLEYCGTPVQQCVWVH